MATHSNVLAWRIPGTAEPGELPLWGCTESDTTEATQQQQQNAGSKALDLYSSFIQLNSCVTLVKTLGEGNGTPLQYSCLENPMDGGAW